MFLIAWAIRGFALGGFVPALVIAAVLMVIIAVGTVLILYANLRQREEAEIPVDRPPAPEAVAAIMRRENHAYQNHLAALSVIKPGLLRRLTLVLAFWVIGQLASTLFPPPGFLSTLGTIHSARWVRVPATDLIFSPVEFRRQLGKLSGGLHHQGAWRPYWRVVQLHRLSEDDEPVPGWRDRRRPFQTLGAAAARSRRASGTRPIRAHHGQIRRNAVPPQGLGAALTEEEAGTGFPVRFANGAADRRPSEAREIQSIVFGGLAFLRHGEALLFRFGGDVAVDAALGSAIRCQLIAFGDGRFS